MTENVQIHRLFDAIGEDIGKNSDSHAEFLYLLYPLLSGSTRGKLLSPDTPLSEVYYGIQNIASIGDAALAWMWYLLDACKRSKHTNDLRKHIKSPVVRALKPKLMLRMTLSSIASSLELAEVEKLVNFVCRTTLENNPHNFKVGEGAFKALLELFSTVEKREIITSDNIGVLCDWLCEVKRVDLVTELVNPYDANRVINIPPSTGKPCIIITATLLL